MKTENHANYRKFNDRSFNSSTYHKKDGTPIRAILKEELRREVMEVTSKCPSCKNGKITITATQYSPSGNKKLDPVTPPNHNKQLKKKMTMSKRKFKQSYHCSKINTNIIEKQSYCGEPITHKKCVGCPHRINIDHSNDIQPFNIVKEGNQLVDSGIDRTVVIKNLISKYNLNPSNSGIIKRHIKHSFK
jgi:hypothetical protein